MEREYGELYYLDVKEIIRHTNNESPEQREFVNNYLEKIAVYQEEDPLVTISPMDSETFGSLILDIINDYEVFRSTARRK